MVGLRDCQGGSPEKCRQKSRRDRRLCFSDEEGELAFWSYQSGCGRQGKFEALDRTEGYDVSGEAFVVLGAHGEDLDVAQRQRTNDFTEEGGLLVVRFDQRGLQGLIPQFEGQAREASAGTDVDKALSGRLSRSGEELLGREKGLAEMSCHDIVFVANCGEIHAGVPAEQKIEIGRDGLQLRIRERLRSEWLEQFSDAGCFHRKR